MPSYNIYTMTSSLSKSLDQRIHLCIRDACIMSEHFQPVIIRQAVPTVQAIPRPPKAVATVTPRRQLAPLCTGNNNRSVWKDSTYVIFLLRLVVRFSDLPTKLRLCWRVYKSQMTFDCQKGRAKDSLLHGKSSAAHIPRPAANSAKCSDFLHTIQHVYEMEHVSGRGLLHHNLLLIVEPRNISRLLGCLSMTKTIMYMTLPNCILGSR